MLDIGASKEVENNDFSQKTGSLLLKKCSIFEEKQGRHLLDNIVSVVEGFQTDDKNLIINEVDQVEQETKNLVVTKTTQDENKALDAEILLQSLKISDCTVCNIGFQDREEQVNHYKCDVHLFNLKQKMKGRPSVSVDEFEDLSDISSISASDTEDEAESSEAESSSDDEDDHTNADASPHYALVARNKPKISFRLNDQSALVMFRCILHGKRDIPESQQDLLTMVKSIKSEDGWCIILIAAGHFAAAIFKGEQVLAHKTFHRYVVRAKRGTVQSQHDSKGGHAQSAGAGIRRSQEAHFREDIRQLIGVEWREELDKCKCIFLRVPKYNRNILVSNGKDKDNKTTFNSSDKRLRHIPFMTFRPTFNEIKRTHTLLSKVELYDSTYSPTLSTRVTKSKPQVNESARSKRLKKKEALRDARNAEDDDNENDEVIKTRKLRRASRIKVIKTNEEIEPVITEDLTGYIQGLSSDHLKAFNEIYTAMFTNNAVKLEELFEAWPYWEALSIPQLLAKRLTKDKGYTLLHLAAELGNADCIGVLLGAGADPVAMDVTKHHNLPYTMASTKKTRDMFRLYMNEHPEQYDWQAAHITSALTREQMEEKAAKEREKKKQQKKLKANRDAVARERDKLANAELAEKNRFANMGDAEKRRMIMEKRSAFYSTSDNSTLKPMASTTLSTAATSTNIIPVNVNRCWTCGCDMTNLLAFEYFDYKFCSSKCLKIHRTTGAATKSK